MTEDEFKHSWWPYFGSMFPDVRTGLERSCGEGLAVMLRQWYGMLQNVSLEDGKEAIETLWRYTEDEQPVKHRSYVHILKQIANELAATKQPTQTIGTESLMDMTPEERAKACAEGRAVVQSVLANLKGTRPWRPGDPPVEPDGNQ